VSVRETYFTLLVCFYCMVELELNYCLFCFVACIKVELINIKLMPMNCVPEHSQDHADSVYVP